MVSFVPRVRQDGHWTGRFPCPRHIHGQPLQSSTGAKWRREEITPNANDRHSLNRSAYKEARIRCEAHRINLDKGTQDRESNQRDEERCGRCVLPPHRKSPSLQRIVRLVAPNEMLADYFLNGGPQFSLHVSHGVINLSKR